MAHTSTVLAQSAVAEGGDLFPALLAHLRRLYPEVCGRALFTGWAPQRREVHIGEGGGLSVGTSVNSIKQGSYAGIFTNLNLAGMNNLSPNLTTLYLYTPRVGPTPEPLEYVPSPGPLCSLAGIPQIVVVPKVVPHPPRTVRIHG